jgi:hypothetical protein
MKATYRFSLTSQVNLIIVGLGQVEHKSNLGSITKSYQLFQLRFWSNLKLELVQQSGLSPMNFLKV